MRFREYFNELENSVKSMFRDLKAEYDQLVAAERQTTENYRLKASVMEQGLNSATIKIRKDMERIYLN